MLCHEVSQLLRHWTLAKFLARKPPSGVVVLHDDQSLVDVLSLFARHNILSAPVFHREEMRYLGFLDLLDVVQAVLSWFPDHGSNPDLLAAYIKQAGPKLESTRVGDIQLRGNDAQLVYQAYLNATLLEVVREGFLKPAAAGRPCHRLAVFDYDPAAADPADAAAGLHFTSIVSQSDVVAFLHQHRAELGHALLGATLAELGLREKRVVCVPSDMPAIHAFRAVLASHVGCAGVVELHSHGALVGQLSTSDLRGILPHHFDLLGLPVLDFLARSLGGWDPPPTPLTQSYGVKSPRKHTKEVHVATCLLQSTLGEVLERVVGEHLHRLYVVDGAGRPLTVLTLTDILALLDSPPG